MSWPSAIRKCFLDRTFLARLLRFAIYTALSLLSATIGISLALHLAVPLMLWIAPSLETSFYDLGLLGFYRTNRYVSFGLQSPRASTLLWEESCNSGYIMIDPNGPSVDHRGPTILDADGNLIWTSDQFETTTNLKVQQYQGKDYLTFWSGQKAQTMGTGAYIMVSAMAYRQRSFERAASTNGADE